MKKTTIRISLALALFAASFIAGKGESLGMALAISAYGLAGYDVLWRALRNIVRGKVFDENFLMSLATIGAFALGDFSEGAAVMLFYQVGELFQRYAVERSRKSISDLMDIRPDAAFVLRDGKAVGCEPESVKIGEIILIKPGERVPLDAVITKGSTTLDTAALTGESMPRDGVVGDSILSGCVNLSGVIEAAVEKEFYDSTVSKILDLVENATSKKSSSENFITRFARYYTPAVVLCAVALAFLPPLILGDALSIWISRALIFLVVSCPCALVISIPLSFFGGIGGASRHGILVKGSNYLEMLAKTEIVVFDKTGTLTKGSFKVLEIAPQGVAKSELLRYAACAESASNHPIAASLRAEFHGTKTAEHIQEDAGYGVSALVDGKKILAGSSKLMTKHGIAFSDAALPGTVVHVAVNGAYAGYILIGDTVKDDAAAAIKSLKQAGVQSTVMLTGDSRASGEAVASALGLDAVYTQLLPADKVSKLEELMTKKSAKGKLVFVGDGINDAPVLARADIGIAMGGIGSDAAIEAADVVIMTDEPSKIATAIKASKKTLRIANQNIVFALVIKAAVLVLGAFGDATMWEAVFADVGVSVIAILNSFRALRVPK